MREKLLHQSFLTHRRSLYGPEQHITEDAVSPVIGVMLMLVVTIIIAAVVSGFAGGMMKSEQTAPQASFECVISNDGSWGGSSFDLTCLGTSEGIPTKA